MKPEKLYILVVDDSEEGILLAQALLAPYAIEVITAEHGAQAVNIIQSGEYLFDLVLMDIEMPIMNGIEATKTIRLWEEENGKEPLKILSVSATRDSNKIELAKTCGHNAFYPRPLTKQKLLEMIKEYTGFEYL